MPTGRRGVTPPLRVAVIGVGVMGRHHAGVYRMLPDVELAGLVEPNPWRRRDAQRLFGCPVFTDLEELLATTRLDAASVAAPTTDHHDLTLRLLQAGVHVLVEKPVATRVTDAMALAALSRDRGLVLQVGHITRFFRAVERLRAEVRAPYLIEARRLTPNGRIQDVGVVLDLMIHDIDLVLELAGAPVLRLAAAGGRSADGPIDYVNATLAFANGVVASLTASKMAHRKIRSLSAHCRDSLVETDFLNRTLHIHRRSHQSVSADHGELVYRSDGLVEEVSTTSIEPLYAELTHFLACVRGDESPAVDGLQASRALLLADLIEQCVEQPNLCMSLEQPI